MKSCPFCNESLEVIDVDPEGYDILGCSPCDYTDFTIDPIDEMQYYI